MPLSMYQASIPVLTRGLDVLSTLLGKGAAHADAGGHDRATIVAARLAPDMLPLSGQIQRASDTAKFAAARLTGVDGPSFADEEATLDDLQERCAKTIAYLETVSLDAFAGSETRQITFGGGTSKTTLPGDAYLLHFALPNFFFHVTTAYDILRHVGVPLSKLDYLGMPSRS
ncbi:DUF1993 domain-containing protein [Methylobacterium sp. C25]|uniref:DUF1993 domain-containing protein n=1 Tax=Methylobacterium sp. C25 TaxID=2721622 RepID=UPI001F3A475B|nr:DUF1993 domain-containing protein [Methylobacterium sp. C25]MCE4226621.1 DUF1993 domain-containing protein [Methylobacterium sp. C25]